MAKKKTAAKSMELDAKEFFAAISDIEKEKGIPKSYMIDKITQALVAAYKRDHAGITDNVIVDANEEKCSVRMFVKKEVVEEVTNPNTEVAIADARRALPRVALGDVLRIEIKPKNFGRIAAQTARQVIVQGMREAERSMIFDAFSAKEHEIISGVVTRVDARNGSVSVRLTSGSEFTDSFLSADEQVPGEVYTEGQTLQVYVVDVVSTERGPRVMISRTHPGLVKRLFELEVPEIFDGTVEVKAISREAGARTKMAVWSKDPNVNPVSACIGEHGARVAAVVEKLGGEKIDIVKWSEDISEFISAALSPAKVVKVELLPGETRSCRVTVPDQQLSLAIGNKGQNARLCARLTGYNIDIRPESGYYGEEEPKKEAETDAE